jgi:hypothetical protein
MELLSSIDEKITAILGVSSRISKKKSLVSLYCSVRPWKELLGSTVKIIKVLGDASVLFFYFILYNIYFLFYLTIYYS